MGPPRDRLREPLRERVLAIMIGNREVSEDQRQQTDRQHKSLWLSNKDNNNNNNKGFEGACVTQFAWQVELDSWFAGWFYLL